MSETVYIETSILGYLTARSTRNLIIAGYIGKSDVFERSQICKDYSDRGKLINDCCRGLAIINHS